MHVYFISSFMQKGEKNLVSLCYFLVYAKKEKEFGEFMYVYFHIYAYMCCLVYALY